MTKHTPGPWSVSESHSDSHDVLDADGFPVAETPAIAVLEGWSKRFPKLGHWAHGGSSTKRERGEGEAMANARLIAAAPELLAVLESLTDHCAKHGSVPRSLDTVWSAAMSAIRKARG